MKLSKLIYLVQFHFEKKLFGPIYDAAFAEIEPDCLMGHLKLAVARKLFTPLSALHTLIIQIHLKVSPSYRNNRAYFTLITRIHRFLRLFELNAPEEIIGNERRMVGEQLVKYLSLVGFHKWPYARQEKFFKNAIPRSLKKEGLTDHEKWQPIYLDMINRQLATEQPDINRAAL